MVEMEILRDYDWSLPKVLTDILNTTFAAGGVRLIGSNGKISSSSVTGRMSGRLEVLVRGRWGTVCDDSFEHTQGGSSKYGQTSNIQVRFYDLTPRVL